MISKTLKVIASSAGLIASVSAYPILSNASAIDGAATGTTNFNVNVKEVLSVSIDTPSVWASGDMNTFLRNKVSVSVTSNNAAGFVATMTSKTTDTFLTNTSKNIYTLPTLAASSTRGSFPANYWGYSLDDTDDGSSSSTYNAMVASNATPITLLSSTTAMSGSKDFYFGAKGDSMLAAGTYAGTVVISVVSGVIDEDDNPVTPVDPVTPGTDDTPTYHPSPTGGSTNGTTAYTHRSSDASSATTTTEVSDGDNVDIYDGYTPPQGVTMNTISNIVGNSALATGLALAASIAATSGMFLILAARSEGDDDEEDEDEGGIQA